MLLLVYNHVILRNWGRCLVAPPCFYSSPEQSKNIGSRCCLSVFAATIVSFAHQEGEGEVTCLQSASSLLYAQQLQQVSSCKLERCTSNFEPKKLLAAAKRNKTN